MSFRVDLDTFRGPLDLLLYLVRRHELDIADIPIAKITNQYLEQIEVLKELDVDAVGDFLDLASTLIEIKSKMVLPQVDEEAEQIEDPRDELVHRLLEYKKYRDASSILEDQSRQWQQHYARVANDLPPRQVDPADQPIQELELWDLVSAFGRIMRDHKKTAQSNIVYDETPLQVYIQQIHQQIAATGNRVAFSHMFRLGMHKSAMIGMFLAILELTRHHGVVAEQDELDGEIWILPGENFSETLDLSNVDDYSSPSLDNSELDYKPR